MKIRVLKKCGLHREPCYHNRNVWGKKNIAGAPPRHPTGNEEISGSASSAWKSLRALIQRWSHNSCPHIAASSRFLSFSLSSNFRSFLLLACVALKIFYSNRQPSLILTLHVPCPPDGVIETDFISPLKLQAFKIFPFWRH